MTQVQMKQQTINQLIAEFEKVLGPLPTKAKPTRKSRKEIGA